MYKLCVCGHTELDHLYPNNYPWWKFWKVGNQLGPCYNRECKNSVVFSKYSWTERCVWFKQDNLKYIEQVYKYIEQKIYEENYK